MNYIAHLFRTMPTHIIQKSDHFYDKIMKWIVLLVFSIYIITNVCSNFSNILYKPFVMVFGISVIGLYVLFLLSKVLHSDKIAILLLTVISLLVLIGWNLIYKPLPVSDYEVIWEGAHQVLDGSFFTRASNQQDYFYFFNFQIPFTYYCAILLKIHDSLTTLKIAEIISLTLTNIILYKIMRLFSNIGISFFCSAFFAFFPYIFIGSGIINNQHIGMMCCALAIYIFLKEKNLFLKYCLSSFILAVGNLLRPSLLMIMVSIVFVVLLQCLVVRQTRKQNLIGLLFFISTFFLTNELINMLFIGLSLAPYGIKSSNLYFKLILGLTGSGLTKTNTTDAEHPYLYYDLLYYQFDYDKYKEASQKFLIQLFTEKKLDFNYVLQKLNVFISGIDNQYRYGDSDFNYTHLFLMECLNFGGIILYVFALFGAFFQSLKQKILITNTPFILPVIIFCAYFGIYIFIEVQTRYRYEQYYVLMIISSPFIYSTIKYFNEKIKKLYSGIIQKQHDNPHE